MYDVYVSLTKEYEQKYTYEQAIEIVKKALAVLGDDYVALLDKGFSERWVDVYENEGKKSGAYSWGSYDSHPYVLMSFNGNIDSVFTLAHEMGHSLHSWYSNHTQPFTYAEYRLFVAEVASTCNEALLIRYLLKHAKEKEEKIFLLNYFLDQFKGTVFRQTMFAEFEKRIHEKMAEEGTLTADGISELYLSDRIRFRIRRSRWNGREFRIFIHRSMYISMQRDFRRRLRSAARSWQGSRVSWRSTNSS